MSVNLDVFKEKIFKYALDEGFENGEIYFARSNNFEVRMFNKEVNSYKNTDVLGVSFRGVYNDVMGYSFSEKVDYDIIPFLVNSAKENALIIEDKEKEELYPGDDNYSDVKIYNEELEKISVERKMKDIALLEEIALNENDKVKSVDYCVLSTGSSETHIANTLGLDLKKRSNFALSYISPRVKEKDDVKVGLEYWIGNDYSKYNPEELAKTAVNNAILKLGAKQVKTGVYEVIIENKTFIDFFSSFAGLFFAENVQKGFSLFKDKVGHKIASDVITIKDNPLLDNYLGSTSFDSEGVRTYNKNIVEDGELKTYLYNLKSAKKDNVKSTGNGFKSGFKSYVSTAATNFYIENGNVSLDELIKKMNNGVLITDLAGLHSGINPISGDFSLLASGFQIINGQISSPIEQITIAGNFFELFLNIKDIANDLIFTIPTGIGNFGSPSIYVGALNIAGE